MKAIRMVSWKTRDGKDATVEIIKIREVRDNISYADGWNINLGKETVDRLEITVRINGKEVTRDYGKPCIVTRNTHFKTYDKIKAAGGYAQIGNAYVNEENYNKVMTAIAEVEAEAAGDAEFAQVKAKEMAEEARNEAALEAAEEQYRRDIKNGMCPKCGSWCYGDCEAH